MDNSEHHQSSHHPGLDGALDEIIRDVCKQLAEHHDQETIEKVMRILADQFQGVRITAYLPILIKKKAFEHLRSLRI